MVKLATKNKVELFTYVGGRAWPRVIHFRNEDIDLVVLALHNVEILFVKLDLLIFIFICYTI